MSSVRFSAIASEVCIERRCWRVVYANKAAKDGMEDLRNAHPQHYAEVCERLSVNPFDADGRFIAKLHGKNRQYQPYEYRLPHAWRLIYLPRRSVGEVEILRVGPHF